MSGLSTAITFWSPSVTTTSLAPSFTHFLVHAAPASPAFLAPHLESDTMPLTVVESAAKDTPTIMNITHRARQISNSFLMANFSSIVLAAGPQLISEFLLPEVFKMLPPKGKWTTGETAIRGIYHNHGPRVVMEGSCRGGEASTERELSNYLLATCWRSLSPAVPAAPEREKRTPLPPAARSGTVRALLSQCAWGRS